MGQLDGEAAIENALMRVEFGLRSLTRVNNDIISLLNSFYLITTPPLKHLRFLLHCSIHIFYVPWLKAYLRKQATVLKSTKKELTEVLHSF